MSLFKKTSWTFKSLKPYADDTTSSSSTSVTEWYSAISSLSVRNVIEDGINSVSHLSAKGSLSDCEEAMEENEVKESLEKTKTFYWISKIFCSGKKYLRKKSTPQKNDSFTSTSPVGEYSGSVARSEVSNIRPKVKAARRRTIATSTPFEAARARKAIKQLTVDIDMKEVDPKLEELRQKFLANCHEMQNSWCFSEVDEDDHEDKAEEQLRKYHERNLRMHQECLREEKRRAEERVKEENDFLDKIIAENAIIAKAVKEEKYKIPPIPNSEFDRYRRMYGWQESDRRPVKVVRRLRL